MAIDIYEGENEMSKDNTKLGCIRFHSHHAQQ